MGILGRFIDSADIADKVWGLWQNNLANKFDPSEPRDERGRWTSGGVAFASPSVNDKDFAGAARDLTGHRQKVFQAMAKDIDKELGVLTRHAGVIGAWADGAENSTLTEGDPKAVRLATLMKGHLAAQKAVLTFTKAKDGPSALYDMSLPGTAPQAAHDALLKAGIGFHTLVPTPGGTRALVVDTDGSLGQAVGDFAVAHKTTAVRSAGHAEFIGDQDGTGSDAQQRARGRAAYEKAIASDASRYHGSSAGDVWDRVRARWASRLAAAKALTFGAALAAVEKFNPNHDDHGRFAATDSPEFKAWFKGSKVVDGAGKPLRMFHGTDKDFPAFSNAAINSNFEYSYGFHFSDRPDDANVYTGLHNDDGVSDEGGRVIPVYLSVKNPLVIDLHGDQNPEGYSDVHRMEIIRQVVGSREAGKSYDGVILRSERYGTNVITFDPAQIKSAVGNRGSFDPKEKDMTKAQTFGDALAKLAGAESLYVHRPVQNAARLHQWATTAGIPNIVPPHEMHVTQVYSRQPVDLEPRKDTVTAVGDQRGIAMLGDKGAAVLHFQSDELQARHREAMHAGASHDWPQYLTHVTLSYDTKGTDLSAIEPPSFPLVFGPEVHATINDNWAQENGLRKMVADGFRKVMAKYDPSEPRDDQGQWTTGGGAGPSPKGRAMWDAIGGMTADSAARETNAAPNPNTGPTLGEASDEDTAYEQMAQHLQNPGKHGGIDINNAKGVKAVWIKNSPLKTLDDVYNGAPANKAELDKAGAEIAAATGAEYRAPGLKKLGARTLQKATSFSEMMKMAERGNNPAAVTDIVRSTFVVSTPEQGDHVARLLAEKFPTTDEGYKFTPVGYFDRAVNMRFKNGQIGEALIAPPELVQAKSGNAKGGGGGHDLYDEWRVLPDGTPRKAELAAGQIKIYGEARAKLSHAWDRVLQGAHHA